MDPPRTRSVASPTKKIVEAKPRYLRDASNFDRVKEQVSNVVGVFVEQILPTSWAQGIVSVMQPPTGRPKILWATFQKLALSPKSSASETQLHLVLGYKDAFQIWDVTDFKHVVEVALVHDSSVKCLEYIPTSEKESVHNDKLPLIAFSCPNPNKKGYLIKIYSLQGGQTVQQINAGNDEVHCLRANSRFLVSVSRNTVCVYSTSNFSKVTQFEDCRINPTTGHAVMALGPRWLAYATTTPAVTKKAPPKQNDDAVSGVITELKKIGAYIPIISQQFFSYSSQKPENDTASNSTGTTTDSIGTVIVRDLLIDKEDNVVGHFVAHSNSPISKLAFSPNGAVLASVSTDGLGVSLFQLLAAYTQDGWVEKELYYLPRSNYGRQAIIEDITFSPNGKWVAFTSASGTSHVFPINPFGGKVDVTTHAGVDPSRIKGYKLEDTTPEEIRADVSCQIRHRTLKAEEDEIESVNSSSGIVPHTPVAAAFYFNPRDLDYPDGKNQEASSVDSPDVISKNYAAHALRPQILNIYPSGDLVFTTIKPYDHYYPRTPSDPIPKHKLEIDYESLIEWQLGLPADVEKINKCEVTLPIPRKNSLTNHWANYFDTITYPNSKKKLWNGTQFAVKHFIGSNTNETAVVGTESAASNVYAQTLEIRRKDPVPVSEATTTNPSNPKNTALISAEMQSAMESNMEFSHTIVDDDVVSDQSFEFEGNNMNFTDSVDAYSPSPEDDEYVQEFEDDGRAMYSTDGDNELGAPNDSMFLPKNRS